MSGLDSFMWLMIILVSFVLLFYYLGTRRFDSEDLRRHLEEMSEVVADANAHAKGKATATDDGKKNAEMKLKYAEMMKGMGAAFGKSERKKPLLGGKELSASELVNEENIFESCWNKTASLFTRCTKICKDDDEDE